jgi:hypothetical protein
METSQQPLRTS